MGVNIDKSWTLCLDRDGVINKRLIGDYVKTWDEFEFMPGVIDTLKSLVSKFSRVFIFTNQQGIGKGLMTEKELDLIHLKMSQQLNENKISIDKVYFCPHLSSDNCMCRKPKQGMIDQCQSDYPNLDLKKTVMVGDSISDLEFGKGFGAHTVMINKNEGEYAENQYVDEVIKDFQDLLTTIN